MSDTPKSDEFRLVDRRSPAPSGSAVASALIALAKMGGPPLLIAVVSGIFYLGWNVAQDKARIDDMEPHSAYEMNRVRDSLRAEFEHNDAEARESRQDSTLQVITQRLDVIVHLLRVRVCREQPEGCP